jgi:hypothetical protein
MKQSPAAGKNIYTDGGSSLSRRVLNGHSIKEIDQALDWLREFLWTSYATEAELAQLTGRIFFLPESLVPQET